MVAQQLQTMLFEHTYPLSHSMRPTVAAAPFSQIQQVTSIYTTDYTPLLTSHNYKSPISIRTKTISRALPLNHTKFAHLYNKIRNHRSHQQRPKQCTVYKICTAPMAAAAPHASNAIRHKKIVIFTQLIIIRFSTILTITFRFRDRAPRRRSGVP